MGADRIASTHPRPFVGGRIELPKVVEFAGNAVDVVIPPPKEPEITIAIGPAGGEIPASRCVSRRGRSQCAVDSGLAAVASDGVVSAHPRPFAGGGIELPKVVEIAEIAVGIVPVASQEPEIATVVGPARGADAASGNVS